MKLPNKEKAYIPDAKLVNYLLSPTHPEGGPKSIFFEAAGYNRMNAEELQRELLRIARQEEVTQEIISPYGTKYIIEGRLARLHGNEIPLRTVWIINKGESNPVFVTAYPL